MQHPFPARDLSFIDLFARAVDGDKNALGQLLLEAEPCLMSAIRRDLQPFVSPFITAEDVLQEVFFSVFRHIGRFKASDGEHRFLAWMLAIAHNRTIDASKAAMAAKRRGDLHHGRTGPDDDGSGVLLDVLEADTETPSRCASRREAVEALRVAMASLRREHREILQMRFLESVPVSEIARKLDMTPGAVHMASYRALKRLAVRMGPASNFLSSHS